MNPALLEAATTARARRAAAARVLADAPRRAQLGWSDLSAWPAWAQLPAAERDTWLCAVGAWFHAAALRQCIDGRVLQQLQALIGSSEATRLLQAGDDAGASAAPHAPPWTATTLPALLAQAGREAALAAVPSPVLRLMLREAFWPDTLAPLPAIDTATAVGAVAAAGHVEARP